MDIEKEVQTIRNIVIKLLRDDPRCRNDDKWLIYRVMRYFTKIYIPFEDFSKIPAFDTIRRTRQKIQNEEHLYPPTNSRVIERRDLREHEMKGVLKYY